MVMVLVHPRDSTAAMLQLTMSALKQAHFLGDDVELRVVLHESSMGIAEVRRKERVEGGVKTRATVRDAVRPELLSQEVTRSSSRHLVPANNRDVLCQEFRVRESRSPSEATLNLCLVDVSPDIAS